MTTLYSSWTPTLSSLRWRHNDHAGVSNHQPHGCLLNRLFRRKSKKTSKLRVTGLCVGNSPGTGEFPAQMASYAENVSIWWRHHDIFYLYRNCHHPHSEWWIWHLQWCCPFSSPKIKGVVYTCDAMACKHFQHNRPFVRRIQRSSLDPPHVKWRFFYQSVGNTRATITQLLALEKGKRRPWQLFHGTA